VVKEALDLLVSALQELEVCGGVVSLGYQIAQQCFGQEQTPRHRRPLLQDSVLKRLKKQLHIAPWMCVLTFADAVQESALEQLLYLAVLNRQVTSAAVAEVLDETTM
jgi:hypothetical protein